MHAMKAGGGGLAPLSLNLATAGGREEGRR